MASDRPAGRPVRSAIAAALLSLAGCNGTEAPARAEARTAPAQAMSYEVAIAIATADRNRAVEECGVRPEPERATCVTVARANWDAARAALDDLRGDQQ